MLLELCLIEKLIQEEKYVEVVAEFENNAESYFSPYLIREMYPFVAQIPLDYFRSNLSRLRVALFAFLNGDNKKRCSILRVMNPADFLIKEEIVLYYSIRAISESCNTLEERFEMAKKAIKYAPDSRCKMIQGYSYYVYSQLAEKNAEHNKSETYYNEAFRIFESIECHYMSAIVFANWQVMRCNNGNYMDVIKKSYKEMNMKSAMDEHNDMYVNTYSIPLGVGYFMLNKLGMAEQVFVRALNTINHLDLIHLNGHVVKYLFACYKYKGQIHEASKLVNEFELKVSLLNDPILNLWVCVMKLQLNLEKKEQPKERLIESIELAYKVEEENCDFIVKEALIKLALLDLSHTIDLKKMEKIMEYVHLKNNISEIIQVHLLYSLFMEKEKNERLEKYHFRTACELGIMYKTSVHLLGHFKKYGFKFSVLSKENIQKLIQVDIRIKSYIQLELLETFNLTEREMDVLLLVGRGYSNKEISDKLYIGLGTVKWHINNLYSKMGVKKRNEARQIAGALKII